MASGRVPKTLRTVFSREVTCGDTTARAVARLRTARAAGRRLRRGSAAVRPEARQREGEGRPLVEGRLHPDVPAVLLDDALRDHEPETRAARLARGGRVELREA